MPLRVRLALIAAIGLTLVLLGTGFAFVHLLRDNLTATIDASLWSRRHALLATLREQPQIADSGLPASTVLQSGTQLFSTQGTLVAQSSADVDDTGTAPLLTPGQVSDARGGPIWLTTAHTNAPAPVRVLAFALPPTTGDAVGVVSESMAVVDQAVDHVQAGFLFGGPVLVVGGAIAAWLLAGAAVGAGGADAAAGRERHGARRRPGARRADHQGRDRGTRADTQRDAWPARGRVRPGTDVRRERGS